MYKFSAPMPYNLDDIQKLLDINNQIEKSKITSLYACLPSNCELFTGFEQSRNFTFEHNKWDYWKKLIEYTLFKGCDFIYLLNCPKPLDIDNHNFKQQLEKLEKLLEKLKSIGVNKLRVASGQLSSYIGNHYNEFEVLASTSLEYKTIWEYQNFIHFHSEVRQIVPSHDVNKNFKLLKILKKRYPRVEIELMVNEGCLQGCPNRMLHESISIDKHTIINNDECLSGGYATGFCGAVIDKYPIQSLVIGTHIFPWDIKEYSKIGINNFKLVGRDGYSRIESYINAYTMYLKGIDDEKYIENFQISNFFHHLVNIPVLKTITVKECKKYFPDIKQFIKYGHLCASRCAVECKYCYKCAEKIQKYLIKQQKKEAKINVSPCFI